ncbi:proteoglycan 4-like isoform X2 [Daphnia carinata]|nr:proteoglycan 4-like isoform X2 [Daphnia carinata]
MLARPLQGAGPLHGLESASNPPPLSNTTQLGAGKESSIEAFSSSQSRSVSGRSPNRFTDLPGARVTNSANSASVIEHVIAPNHNQPLATTPTRRLSEPNRTRTIMVEETRMKSSTASQVDMVGNRPKITTKGLNALKAMTGNRDNEDEELQYGPGIVNKLKSRYLSRTLRERPLGESRRPSLRRAASLEDWLDKDSSPPHPSSNDNNFAVLVRSSNGRAKSERPASLNLAAPTAEPKLPPRPLSSSPVKIRDLKKTRSVDCVSQQPTWRSVAASDLVVVPSAQQQPKPSKAQATVPPSPTVSSPKTPVHLLLGKDAIVIVDKDDNQVAATDESKGTVAAVTAHTAPTASSPGASKARRTLPTNIRYNVEDAELPAPDTVRQVKRIFESGSGRKVLSTRRSQSAGPGINRTPLSAANQTIEKSNIHRMNQVNLVNNKSISSVARKKSESTPRITELVSSDTKPVVITKPSPIGPKPAVLSPKPAVVIDKTRVVQSSSSNGAPSLQRTTAPPAKLAAQPAPTAAFVSSVTAPTSKESSDQLDNKDELENHAGGHGFKIISKTALDNIREESNSVKFNFDEKKDDKSPFSLGSVQSRQVGVIRPQPKSPVIHNDKPVVLEELAPKDDVDSVSKKEELLVTAASNTVLIGLAKSQPKTELAQSQTTSKPASPAVFAPKFQAASRTKQITAPATVSKSEPVILTHVISPSSPTAPDPASVSVTPPAEKKATDNPTVVTVPAVKTLSSSSQIIAKPSNSAPVNAAVGAHSISSGTTREQPTKKWHPHQSETTTVFNFVNDTSRKTDHIRNEGGSSGILVYKSNDSGITKLPDYDPGESSDFIDDLDILKRPPSPCNVDFEGANVIVGKSLIQRRSKKSKMNISFNDDMTKLFEYPSETSLLEEGDDVKSSSKKSDQDFRETPSQIATSNSKGGLSSYTPSKVHFETTFELGISRSTLPDSSLDPNPPSSPLQIDSVLHYIKPAEESTTWSAETTADLLF